MSNQDFAVDTATTERQRIASDPSVSAWVGANAGSGKTYVLAQRVIRLLLDGCDPASILCLTYTKAAAIEMADRVLKKLSEWTLLDDAKLRKELSDLTNRPVKEGALIRARQLFAVALETPGGLKIQTIHAFCERLLHQFPVEANVPGHFEVLDDVAQERLISEAERIVLLEASQKPEGEVGEALRAIVLAASDGAYEKALHAFLNKRRDIMTWIEEAGGVAPAIQSLRRALGLSGNETVAGLEDEILELPHLASVDLESLAGEYAASSSNDQKQGTALQSFLKARDAQAKLKALDAFLFTKDGKPKATRSLATKKIWELFPNLQDLLLCEQKRIVELKEKQAALHTSEATAALMILGYRIASHYSEIKGRRGYLDFDDLVDKAVNLLSFNEGAAWVHYKLDKGIDHILVDEAQDTSPQQWKLICALADEFFAGEGAHQGNPRTVFAVGDEKQSIYSFQGASPEKFSETRAFFAKRAAGAEKPFHPVPLSLSFRSSNDVLSAVDKVFEVPHLAAALSADDYVGHQAARHKALGRVEIWPPFLQPEKQEDPEEWWRPLDATGSASAPVQLAEAIATKIAHWLESGERFESTGKKIAPGDILILTRKRGSAVDAINRALKQKGIAVAGADRLSLSAHIITQDLMALAETMLLSEDDLALAGVLKSPLINLTEEELFQLAHPRKGTLWAALYAHAQDEEQPYKAAYERLSVWRNRADFVPPFDFFSEVLDRDGVREAFKQRIGLEADDILEAFLQQVLTYEESEAATLQGFVSFFWEKAAIIKRDMEAAGNSVRVMTVHGSKGLEAPIVFLADTSAPTNPQQAPSVLALGKEKSGSGHSGPYLWSTSSSNATEVQKDAKQKLEAAELNEYYRLLYVAMTRPRERLYVTATASGRSNDVSEKRWYSIISSALKPHSEEILDCEGNPVAWRWQKSGNEPVPAQDDDSALSQKETKVPDWLFQSAPPAKQEKRLAPSRAGGEDEIVKSNTSMLMGGVDPRQRGTVVHKLLERLPEMEPQHRETAAKSYIRDALPTLEEAECEVLAGAIVNLVDEYADLFTSNGRSEVSVAGKVEINGEAVDVSGQIDRLIVAEDKVTIVDFKSDVNPPQDASKIPIAYQRQLALYALLMAQIYPKKELETALLYTQSGEYLMVDAEKRQQAISGLKSLTSTTIL